MRRLFPVSLAAILATTATVSAQSLPALRTVLYWQGFTAPVAFVQDPSNNQVRYVVEQGGLIQALVRARQMTTFLDLSAEISAGGERGLLGLAFAPDYATSRRLYVNFTNRDGHTVIARFKRSLSNDFQADPASRFDLRWGGPTGLRYIEQPFANHNGGDIHFGPDGFLYIALGDGGDAGDPNNNAQNPNTLLGKMLRIDVNVPDSDPEGYRVPNDNPFVDGVPIAARPEIWSFGWRNPWRFSFDDHPLLGGTSAMYIGDVGQSTREEIDYEPPATGGRNYGWRNFEGTVPYDNSVPPPYSPLTPPLLDYGRSSGVTVIGGVVNRRSIGAPDAYVGRYFYADFTGKVWSTRLVPDGTGGMIATDVIDHTADLSESGFQRPQSISAFGVDWEGKVYIVDYVRGWILQIVPAVRPNWGRLARIDLNADAQADIGVFHPESGVFSIPPPFPFEYTYGRPGDIPVPGYWTLPHCCTEPAVFRPSTGEWFVPNQPVEVWGRPGDIPVPGRYRLLAFDSMAVYRPSSGQWFIKGGESATWGIAGDLPVPADYDGNGFDDIAVYRPSTGRWYVRNYVTLDWGAPGDIPVPADYDADHLVDFAVFRPGTGEWLIRGRRAEVFGAAGDIPVPVDLDGDFRAELVVFRPSTGIWYIHNLYTRQNQTVAWGHAGDIPLIRRPLPVSWRIGDVDGDRRADLTVVRPSGPTWFTAHSSVGFQSYSSTPFGDAAATPVAADFDGDGRQDIATFDANSATWTGLTSASAFTQSFTQVWGAPGDLPVPADYDGDGRTDMAVFRPPLGRWYIQLSAGMSTLTIDWGLPGDVPRPADLDGDGRADIAIYRPSQGRWVILDRFTGSYRVRDWGLADDVPIAADFDGDRRADLTVYRPSEGRWFVLSSAVDTYTVIDWGRATDVPMPLDFDGDGRADIAVYRPSTGRWWVRGLFAKDWGLPGDVPVPNSR